MPLLDHFHPPLSRTHPWRGFHGAWASAMARLLNAGVLPPGFYAVPFLDRDGPVEIDVAALREFRPSESEAGVFKPWSPSEPGLSVAVEWPTAEDVRVEVLSDEGDPRLTAAIELVSPRNKDRPRARDAFASKCAGYLRRGCGLVVVDAVTTQRADLHSDLLAAFGAVANPLPSALSAVSYRAVGQDEAGLLQTWPMPMEIGQPLPTLPLWLGSDLAVPLDLEASHSAACGDLRIRQVG